MKRIPRKTLQQCTEEYIALISSMNAGSNKELIENYEDTILNSFKLYDDNISHLETFTSSCLPAMNIKKALVDKFKTADVFKEKIRRDFSSRKCPYCGYRSLEENVPVEHFLPKSKFQEYSLLGLNLFLCCRECNSKKGSGWITGTRDVLNPYIDDLYDREFIKIGISIGARNPISIEINTATSMTTEERGLLERHFEKFELIRRLSHFINDDIARIVGIIYENQISFSTEFDISTHLKYQYMQEKGNGGTNSILTVVYKYFIDNPTVFASLLEYHKSTKT